MLIVFIAGIILVDAGKKDKLLKKLKKELGYDLKKMMKQVCNWCTFSPYILLNFFVQKFKSKVQKGIKKNSDDIAAWHQEEEGCPPKPTTISPFNATKVNMEIIFNILN